MIKELALKYKNVAFICHNRQDFIEFIDNSLSELEFSKTFPTAFNSYKFIEDREYILTGHLKSDNVKKLALIVTNDCHGYMEFQFYSRNYSEYDSYADWYRFKFIDYTKYLRKEKLIKISSEKEII